MKEHGLIFSSEMVQAFLEHHKSMTRRVVTQHNSIIGEGGNWSKFCWDGSEIHREYALPGFSPPYIEHKAPLPFVDGTPESGQYLHVPYDWEKSMTIYRVYPRWDIGERIYVKETHAFEKWLDDRPTREITTLALRNIWYKASDYFASIALNRGRWRSAMFMPKFAARIRREIIAIRCVRVQDITEEDAKAEGGTRPPNYSLTPYYREWFKYLWNRLNGKKHPWEHNDWVWVLLLKEVENIPC